MTVIELDSIIAPFFISYIGEDFVENLSREYYRGLAVMSDDDGEMAAGIIWEYYNAGDAAHVESVIKWIRIMDTDAVDALFQAYTIKIKEYKVIRSRFVIPVKEGKIEKEVLKQAGFSAKLTEGDDIIVRLSELLELPLARKRVDPEDIRMLNELEQSDFKRGITRCVLAGRKGLCEDLNYLPMDWFEADVSCFAKKDGEICGYLLFHKLPSGMLSIQLMTAMGEDYQQKLIAMMRKTIFAMKAKYPEGTKILLNRHNYASLKLTEKLLPRSFGRPVYAGEREEGGLRTEV